MASAWQLSQAKQSMPLINPLGSTLDWILWLAIGVGVGLLKCTLLRRQASKLVLLDLGAGVGGAVLAGWFLMPISSAADPDSIHIAGLVGALFGASMLVALSVIARP